MNKKKKSLKIKPQKFYFKINFNRFFLAHNVVFNYYLFSSYIFFKSRINQFKKKLIFRTYSKILGDSRQKFSCFLKSSLNNSFITLTDLAGHVIISLSGGKVGLKTKKRKNSPIIIPLLIHEFIKRLRLKGIYTIHTLFLTSPNKKWLVELLSKLKAARIKINQIRYINPRHHNSGLSRKKKIRRI